MDPDYANRTMIRNPQPIIQRKKKKEDLFEMFYSN
jgi:hypothetical protein